MRRAGLTKGRIAAISLAVALLLPLPGPHVDRYVPIALVLARREILEADASFFILLLAILAIYSAVAFTVLAVVVRILRGKGPAG